MLGSLGLRVREIPYATERISRKKSTSTRKKRKIRTQLGQIEQEETDGPLVVSLH